MALISTLNFLPDVFRSDTNQRFFGSTLDQLVTDSFNVPINGYIGRTFAPTYKQGDNYIPEPTQQRTKYQLEPSVVIRDQDADIVFNTTYADLLQNIENYNGKSNNQQRLFRTNSYNYDSHTDYDKFVNYNNYYWLPNGPAAVSVTAGDTPLRADYVVTRNTNVGGYTFSGVGPHPNTQLTLARGGRYTFTVDQPGFKFWLQNEVGTSGVDSNISTVGTREIFGVKNNGIDSGVVTFNVPLATAQDFYVRMPIAAQVDAAATFSYSQIQNRLLSQFLREFPEGIDGLNAQLQNKTIIFINSDVDDELWTAEGTFDANGFNNIMPFDSGGYLPGIAPTQYRRGSWKITLSPVGTTDYLIQLVPTDTVGIKEKVFVKSGTQYASTQFWLNNNEQYNIVPVITAPLNYLFYQDSANPGFVGQIKIVDNASVPIDVNNDILGKVGYTSPNGIKFTNGLKIQFDSLVVPSSYANSQWYVEGVGTAIQLIAVGQLTVPAAFTSLIETTADYITVNRTSQDHNPWSRTNRWFHIDVLNAVAEYNKTEVNYGPNIAGRRPIIEFESSLQLFNFGKLAKDNVDLIVFTATDAFNEYAGQIEAYIQDIKLVTGQRIVFANDYDVNVTNKIWLVDVQTINNQFFIRLIETIDDPVLPYENVLVTQGTYANKTFYFDGTEWSECQNKTAFNQPPLFDLVDVDGYSFSDTTVYPASTFTGTKFFGYDVGTGNNDVLLGFPLKYQNFNNIGDIVFKNYYDVESFTYTGVSAPVKCSTGYIVKNSGLTTSVKLNNWVNSVEISDQYQMFSKFYDGLVVTVSGQEYAFVQIDILPVDQATVPYIKVFLDNALLDPNTDYTVTKVGIYDVVLLTTLPNIGAKIDVAVYSNTVSKTGYYVVPENLDYNPLNETFDTITLGQIRTHYNKLIENTSNNDIPIQDQYVKAQGGTLLQHSGPLLYAMTFLNDQQLNFVDSISLARKEYQRFKNKFLQACVTLTTLDYNDPVAGVDLILSSINSVRNSSFPWYYSDMVPYGSEYTSISYSILNARQTQYEISSIFDDTALGNRAVLVYHNGSQLTKGVDYTFSSTVPAVTILKQLTFGDTLVIRDYASTDGNYIPETPTKLGLYSKFSPEIYTDDSYRTPTDVIRGHDGSLTPAFGDFRDNYLLELERRIYNNIKSNYENNIIDPEDVIPGRFRTTDYSLNEWNQLLSQNFLNWVGVNNIDYTNNEWYDANDPWTWNYNKFVDIVDGSFLQGSWRAIYQYWFDTDTPNITPWKMLGFDIEPSWWEDRYGPGPYTNGNTTLWDDLAAGYVWNNGQSYTNTRFIRPNLKDFIPIDAAGNLLSPTDANLVKQYNITSASSNFSVGEQSPSEVAWRRSSDFPYALQLALALARPAEYFATQIDTSRFFENAITGQFSNIDNKKVTPSALRVNGDTTTVPGTVLRTSGYVNWIGDYLKNLGIDPVVKINSYLQNLNVNLAYKVAGFTDKNILTVSAEQTSPGSNNSSVVLPDNNYDVYLGKSVPVTTVTYSAVIVEKTQAGYSVSGYNINQPFFDILPSVVNTSAPAVVTVNNLSVKIYQSSSTTVTSIPYGTTFATPQQLADFLISYERQLTANGFLFITVDPDLGLPRNWTLSVREFLYWAQQGWDAGTLLVLNPMAAKLSFSSNGSMVDEISNLPNKGMILDQNFVPIKSSQFNILRTESPEQNFFQITALNNASIGFARFNLIQSESVLIFDNASDFGDIIYVPSQGTRQFRLKVTGFKTGAWTGALSAAGYIYSNLDISPWKSGQDYRRGDLIEYNGIYYTATANNVPASQTFNFSHWTVASSVDERTGLLPSLGTQAQTFERIYDVDLPPQDETLQAFSSGLIGFRERPYLTDLGMSIPTQTKFYQGYIKQKGTTNAIEALTRATFNNVSGNIKTYEEWAFHVGTYGDLNGNQYTEFVLDQSEFLNDPVAFTLTANTFSTGNIIANLAVNTYSYTGNITSNVYSAGNILNVSTSLYDNRTQTNYTTDLPTAGFVNVQDIDYTYFDIKNVTSIPSPGDGKKVWVAKDYNDQWNVFRISITNLEATTLVYALDSFAKLTFDIQHTFVRNDYFILADFDEKYDGLYRVVSVPTATSVTIILQNPLDLIATSSRTESSGIIYKLTSAVVNSITDVNSVRPAGHWENNDRLWVNRATSEGWGVYSFTFPWNNDSDTQLTANTVTTNSRFGSAVRIGESYFYVGNPGQSQVKVYSLDDYSANVTVANTNAQFGQVLDAQGNLLIVGSADTVQVYRHTNSITPAWVQTIASANITAVSSVSLSADQHWLYVGGADNDMFEAYYTANVVLPSYSWVKKQSGTVGSLFGQAIKTNSTGSVLIVSASDADNTVSENGNVYIYNRSANTFSLVQTITTATSSNVGAQFGYSLDTDATGTNLFVGVPGSKLLTYSNGVIERWIYNGSSYVYKEHLVNPQGTTGSFGTSVRVTGDAETLAVGSKGSPADEITTFDETTTVIDANTTQFVDYITDSGAVYVFDLITDLTNNSNVYSYVQEIAVQVQSGDEFGYSIDLTGSLVIAGAPGSQQQSGKAHVFVNDINSQAWNLTRLQEPRVDINSINRIFVYNKTNDNILSTIDYIDPAKGKVLNSVLQDIDYQRNNDPAYYNAGSGTVSVDYHWGPEQVGTIWWDLNSVRYIDYEQDSLIYRITHWGEQFPGSQIRVYEWVESMNLPSAYTGTGTPVFTDNSAYSTYGYVDQSGAVKVKYYFWVVNKDTIASGKNNSVYSIAAAIDNPSSQGIAYAVVPRNDTIAIYNINNQLTGQNTILHIGSKAANAGLIHSEYALVQEKNPASRIPPFIESKMIDSLAGQDQMGNVVPDPVLTPAQRYGIGVRPRQTMFIDRQLAWDNYLSIVNNYLQDYPVTVRRVLNLLNSSEPIPSENTQEYDQVVNTEEELSYLNTDSFASGYKVLVIDDSSQDTKWSIYSWSGTEWVLSRVQSYKTTLYWTNSTWYEDGYDFTRAPDVTVVNNIELGKLTLVAGQYVKVVHDADNQFIIYYVEADLSLTVVGIENGTIQISTNTIPAKEMRQIMLSMQNEIFIDDLEYEYNQIFFAIIKYALTEQKNLDWVFKTSFLTATQYIRKLEQFPAYIADNQDYYREYINEVKPYRTVLREFVVNYERNDNYGADITDFDLPPYWDANLQVYRSPSGEQPYDSTLRAQGVYSQWNNNYKYQVVDVVVENAGQDYLFAPQITISGGGGTGATAYATINSSGGIANIYIIDSGSGYTTFPDIIINGTGTGATGRAVLRNINDGADTGHNVVRSIKTNMKFDRVSYTTSNVFVNWNDLTTSNVGETIAANTIIMLSGSLFKLANAYIIDANVTFPTSNVSGINANIFDSANDRITAFNGNIDLSLTQDGIDYPGVIVDGNTSITDANVSSYVGTELDSIIQSLYTDDLGVRPSTIYIDGGEYIDTFESHAPQELIPGRMLNSLSLSVFDTSNLAFKIFGNTGDALSYYRIAAANTTVLSGNLALSDTNIYVDDASVLTNPNREIASPGVIFINGEKITYYRNYALETPTPWASNLLVSVGELITYSSNTYLTLGNVYAQNFANISANVEQLANVNVLTQIRRAVDGTAPSTIHSAGSRVVDAGLQQLVPDTETENVTLSVNTTYTVTDAISYKIFLTANISANIGDTISQIDSNSSATLASMRVLETVSNVTVVPVILLEGGVQGLPDSFDNSLGYDYQGAGGYRIVASSAPAVRPSPIIPTWVANTASPRGSSLYYDGNTYEVVGNVYFPSFANVTNNDGRVEAAALWTANANISVIPTGTIITPNGNVFYVTTGNVYGQYFANIISNVQPYVSNVFYKFAGNVTTEPGFDANLQVDDQWWNTSSNVLYQWNGSSWGIYEPDPAGLGFDQTSDPIYINGNITNSYVIDSDQLGTVDSYGKVTVTAGTTLVSGNVWYNRGITTATDGTGLLNSTTAQAEFLKASRGYTP